MTLNEDDSKTPKYHTFFSSARNEYSCKFYVNSNIEYIMDNPENRSKFGILGGNLSIHILFGIFCKFIVLEKPFDAC